MAKVLRGLLYNPPIFSPVGRPLAHDPEKWKPAFRKMMRKGQKARICPKLSFVALMAS